MFLKGDKKKKTTDSTASSVDCPHKLLSHRIHQKWLQENPQGPDRQLCPAFSEISVPYTVWNRRKLVSNRQENTSSENKIIPAAYPVLSTKWALKRILRNHCLNPFFGNDITKCFKSGTRRGQDNRTRITDR